MGDGCLALVVQSLSDVRLFVTPWTVVCQAPLSMRFSRQEYGSGLPFAVPGDLLDPGIEPMSCVSPALQVGSLPLSHWGSPWFSTELRNRQSKERVQNPGSWRWEHSHFLAYSLQREYWMSVFRAPGLPRSRGLSGSFQSSNLITIYPLKCKLEVSVFQSMLIVVLHQSHQCLLKWRFLDLLTQRIGTKINIVFIYLVFKL